MKTQFSTLSLGVIAILVNACGSNQPGTSTVKIVTGQDNTSYNLMSKITSLAVPVFLTSASCNQTQLFVAHGPHGDGGGTQRLILDSVTMMTPVFPNGDAATATMTNLKADVNADLVGWLSASKMQSVSFSVATGSTVDFGIAGSITPATPLATSANEGNCPLISKSDGITPYPSFSLLGHTTQTISGDTTVPIYLFATDAQPGDASALPLDPGGNCDAKNGNDGFTQQCPNLNFNQIKIGGCVAGTNCAQAATSGYLQVVSFPGSDPTFKIEQWVSLSSLTSTQGAIIADIAPYRFRITYPNAAATTATAFYNDNGGDNNNSGNTTAGTVTPSPSPQFDDGSGTYMIVNSGSGQFAPDFQVNAVAADSPTHSINLTFPNLKNADYFTSVTSISSTGATGQCSVPNASSGTASFTVNLSPCGIASVSGAIYSFQVTAKNSNSGKTTTVTSNPVTLK